MRRKIFVAVLALALVMILTGCFCKHEWVEANCTDPKTCSLCEETEGAPLGHNWAAATCTVPKTCEVCNATEGDAKDHTWEDATCLIPMKCSVCHETKGEPKGHNWEEATTDAPKTCIDCQTTEGNRIITDPRFTTASTKELQGLWACDVVYTGEMLGMADYIDELPCTVFYDFQNDGNLIVSIEIHDIFAFKDAMKSMIIDVTYEVLSYQGIGKNDADAACMAQYGMTLAEYADKSVEDADMDDIFGEMTEDMVYYVGENGLYTALSWYNEFDCSAYTLENDVLIIENEVLEEGGEPLQWKRVKEE